MLTEILKGVRQVGNVLRFLWCVFEGILFWRYLFMRYPILRRLYFGIPLVNVLLGLVFTMSWYFIGEQNVGMIGDFWLDGLETCLLATWYLAPVLYLISTYITMRQLPDPFASTEMRQHNKYILTWLLSFIRSGVMTIGAFGLLNFWLGINYLAWLAVQGCGLFYLSVHPSVQPVLAGMFIGNLIVSIYVLYRFEKNKKEQDLEELQEIFDAYLSKTYGVINPRAMSIHINSKLLSLYLKFVENSYRVNLSDNDFNQMQLEFFNNMRLILINHILPKTDYQCYPLPGGGYEVRTYYDIRPKVRKKKPKKEKVVTLTAEQVAVIEKGTFKVSEYSSLSQQG